jgi:hypothetical protein
MSARKDVHRTAISQAVRIENKGLDGSYRERRRDAETNPRIVKFRLRGFREQLRESRVACCILCALCRLRVCLKREFAFQLDVTCFWFSLSASVFSPVNKMAIDENKRLMTAPLSVSLRGTVSGGYLFTPLNERRRHSALELRGEQS